MASDSLLRTSGLAQVFFRDTSCLFLNDESFQDLLTALEFDLLTTSYCHDVRTGPLFEKVNL